MTKTKTIRSKIKNNELEEKPRGRINKTKQLTKKRSAIVYSEINIVSKTMVSNDMETIRLIFLSKNKYIIRGVRTTKELTKLKPPML